MFINRLAVAAYGCNDNVNVDDDLQQSCGVWQPMVAGKVALFLFLFIEGIFFSDNHNWADGKLHSLQKCHLVLPVPTS